MKRYTKKQVEKYMANPTVCPKCGSKDINGGHVEVDAGGAWQPVDCVECGESWRDVYELVSVERAI